MFEPAPFDILFSIFLASSFLISSKKAHSSLGPALILILSFLVIRTFTLYFPRDLDSSLVFFLVTTYLSLSAALLAILISQRGLNFIESSFRGLYIGTFITSIAVALALLGFGPLQEVVLAYGGTRAKGFFKDPNVMAPTLIPIILYAYMKLFERISIWHALAFAASFALVILSFSRGAMATLVGSILLYTALLSINKGRKAVGSFLTLLALGLMIGGAILAAIYSTEDSKLLLGINRSTEYDGHRFQVHEILIDEILSNPLGHGPGTTNGFLQSHFNLDGSNAAHNTYLRVSFENGWLGIICYLLIMFLTIYLGVANYIKRDQLSNYFGLFLTAFIASSVSAFTIDTLHWRHPWWMAAFIWGLSAHSYSLKHKSQRNI